MTGQVHNTVMVTILLVILNIMNEIAIASGKKTLDPAKAAK